MKVTEQVAAFAEPIVKEHGCELWDVEYVREGSEYFLRLYIDKDGGVDINDCEAISRAVDPILDEKDPIPGSYHFEVCSAGLERDLVRESHFAASIGAVVRMRLIRPDETGQKEYVGALESFDKEQVRLVLEDDTTVTAPFANIAHIKWHEDF